MFVQREVAGWSGWNLQFTGSLMRACSRLLLAAALVGCGPGEAVTGIDTSPPDDDEVALDLWVTPGGTPRSGGQVVALGVNGTLDFVAQVFDDSGALRVNRAVAPVVVSWASSDEGVLTVDAMGRVTAVGRGQAQVVATVEEGGSSRAVDVEVVASDLASLRITPDRVTIPEGTVRQFSVSATDVDGFPAAVSCGEASLVDADASVLTPAPAGLLSGSQLSVGATGRGLTVASLRCDGVVSSPAVVEGRSSLTVPGSSGDFGLRPSVALAGSLVAVSSYDRTAGALLVTRFDGSWSTEQLNGEGDFGNHSAVGLRPDGTVLVCGLEAPGAGGRQLSCWSQADAGFWSKHVVSDSGVADAPVSLKMTADGGAYLMQGGRLWYSGGEPTSWSLQSLMPSGPWGSGGSPRGWSLALGPEGAPRVAFLLTEAVVYGAPVDGEPGSFAWAYEAVASDAAESHTLALAVGDDHRPKVVYARSGALMYGVKLSGTWLTEVVDGVATVGQPGLGVNGWGEPRVAYQTLSGELRYAYRTRRNTWRVSNPVEGAVAGEGAALAIDAMERSQVVYYDGRASALRVYGEPVWLDYSVPSQGPDARRNSGVGGELVGPDEVDTGDVDTDVLGDSDDPVLVDTDQGEPFVVGAGGLTEAMLGTLRSIPAGSFTMGCLAGRDTQCLSSGEEEPAHTVTLTQGFWMMESEVTQGMWQAAFGNNPSHFSAGGAGAACGTNCPVEQVNWWEALAFANAASAAAGIAPCYALYDCTGTVGVDFECASMAVDVTGGHPRDCVGYRLPTEAEWEYAARGGEDYQYAGASDPASVAWYGSNSNVGNGRTTHPVCTKERNGFDLCDMSGNVWEWTGDYLGVDYSLNARSDPYSLIVDSRIRVRGGAYHSALREIRCSRRSFRDRPSRTDYVGVRLARTSH